MSNDLKSIPLWVLFFFVKNWARLTGVIFLLLDSVHENLCQYKCRQAVFEIKEVRISARGRSLYPGCLMNEVFSAYNGSVSAIMRVPLEGVEAGCILILQKSKK